MRERYFMYIYVFGVGMVVMAIEMTAARLLAPLFGTSTVIWAILIGIILAGLAIGYSLGGRLADKSGNTLLIYKLTALISIWIALIPVVFLPFVKWLSTIVGLGVSGFLTTALISVVVMLGPPVVILGMVTPFILRSAISNLNKTGEVAGKIFAVSTFGNIMGIFLPTLVTIPYIGVWQTFEGMAVILLTVSVVGMRRRVLFWMPVVIAAAVVLSSSGNGQDSGRKTIFTKDSRYQHVRVEQNGTMRFLVINEGGGIQSMWDRNINFTGAYWDYFTPLLFLDEKKKYEVLILGAAGGTIARQLKQHLPVDEKVKTTGVEIDPVVAEVGKKYFDGSYYDKLTVADGRQYLTASNLRYDLIIVDAYSQQIYIPFYLATQEFFQLARSRLTDGGIVAINVNAASDNSPLFGSFVDTFKSVFSNVYVTKVPGGGNYIISASNRPLEWEKLNSLTGELESLTNTFQASTKEVKRGLGNVLVDNKAPVEFMSDREIWLRLAGSIKFNQ